MHPYWVWSRGTDFNILACVSVKPFLLPVIEHMFLICVLLDGNQEGGRSTHTSLLYTDAWPESIAVAFL